MTNNVLVNVWYDNEDVRNMIEDYLYNEGVQRVDVAQSDIDNVIEKIDVEYLESIMQKIGEGYLRDVVSRYCDGVLIQREERCTDCAYLFKYSNGDWICDDCVRDIHCIPDDECSAKQEW